MLRHALIAQHRDAHDGGDEREDHFWTDLDDVLPEQKKRAPDLTGRGDDILGVQLTFLVYVSK